MVDRRCSCEKRTERSSGRSTSTVSVSPLAVTMGAASMSTSTALPSARRSAIMLRTGCACARISATGQFTSVLGQGSARPRLAR